MTHNLPLGSVMIDVEGLELTSIDKEKIQHPNTGAIILFARNYESPQQVTELTKQIRNTRKGNILIAVDQEGGRVQRFQTGFTRLPSASSYVGNLQLSEQAGWLMASELLTVGVDFSFAPVLDVDCGVSEIIGDRAFSKDCQQVGEFASAFRQGMKKAGMAATGKHFPGHGAVALDSHLALPIDERDLNSIFAKDLMPFQKLISEGLEAVMPAHIVYPQVDEHAAGFSRIWLQQILREKLGFDGVIFSDDLSMEGAASVGDYTQRAEMALEAGCDMVLVCNNPQAAEQVLDFIPVKSRPKSQQRLKKMKATPMMAKEELFNSSTWQLIHNQLQELNNA